MHKRFTLILGFALPLSISLEGWSLGLGAISLGSHLDEPFHAEIVLLEADELVVSDLQIEFASSEEFARVGVNRDPYLAGIEFTIESDGRGKRVVLKSKALLQAPYLQFVVAATWPGGRLLKEYTVLIPLPLRPVQGASVANTRGAVETESASLITLAVDAGIANDVDRSLDGPSDRPVPGGRYRVTTTDTLWRIASEAAVEGVSIEQTMLRIVAANPSAFQDGNVNGLMAGYVLQLPDETDIRIGLASALDEVDEQNDERGLAVDPVSSGLTLVADSDYAVVAREDSPDVGPEPTKEPEVAQPAEVAPSPNATVPELPELESPLTTVGQLQASIEVLQGRLAEQDAELARLRARLATQDISEPPGGGGAATGDGALPGASGSTQWLRPLSIGAAVLLLAGVMRMWGSRGRHSIPAGEADEMANAGASSITAACPEPELEQSHSQRSDTELPEEDTGAKMATSTAISGLSLAPVDAETEDQPSAVEEHAAIYGSETDPMDSQLDLARAYIARGDEEGARPVLMSVVKEGDLSQQAEARELLLRIEAT